MQLFSRFAPAALAAYLSVFAAGGLLLLTRLHAQAGATLTLTCAGNVQVGAVYPCSLALDGGAAPAGLQFSVVLPPQVVSMTAVSSAAVTATGVAKLLACGNSICLIYGVTAAPSGQSTTIPNGLVATLNFLTSKTVKGANFPNCINCVQVGLSGAVAASAAGGSIPVTVNPPVSTSISTPPCDVNGDGLVNAADVAIERDEALKVTPAVHDLNGSGTVDIVDVQIVIVAMNTGVCPAS